MATPPARGVVATASYAAREYGVRSGMPLRTAARRCPDAVFLPADNPAYEAASEEVMAVLRSFGPIDGAVVEVMGWDEAFVGGGDRRPRGARRADPGGGAHADPAHLLRRHRRQPAARQDRDGVREAARARASAGRCIGAGVFTLTAQNWDEVMGDRPTRALWGIGAKTAAKLADRGLHTVRELAAADPAALAADLGPALGPWYVQLGRGVGPGRGAGRAVAGPLARPRGDLRRRPDRLGRGTRRGRRSRPPGRRRCAGEGRPAARVGVKVRFAPFITRTRSTTLAEDLARPRAVDVDREDRADAQRGRPHRRAGGATAPRQATTSAARPANTPRSRPPSATARCR